MSQMPATPPPAPPSATALPETFWQAVLRGIRFRCPRCGEGPLFHRFLKPEPHCRVCGLDLTPQRADDFPAYIAIILSGHLLAPIIIMLSLDFDLGPGAMAAILLPLAVVMMLGMLQPAKGAVIAAQWWHGMHGFVKQRLPETGTDSAAR